MTRQELLHEVIEMTRDTTFNSEYKDKATEQECLGIAIAAYFDWDTRIFEVCVSALEDANFHTEAGKLAEMADEFQKRR